MTDDPAPADGADSPRRDRIASTLSTVEFRRDRVVLWAVTIVLTAVIGFVAWQYVGTFILGLFVYYVTRPVFKRIHARIESRTLAVVVSLVTVALPVLVLVGWTLSIAFQALSDFLDSDSPGQVEDLIRPYVDISELLRNANELLVELLADPSRLENLDLGPFVSGLTDTVVSSLGVLFNVAIHGFIVLVIAFYLLRDDHRIAKWAKGTLVRDDGVLEAYFVAVDRDLKNVFFGNILNALVTGILAAVTYVTLNTFAPGTVLIPQAAFVGLLVGAASLVPVIGIKLVWVPIALFLVGRALLVDPQLLWFPAVFAAVSVVIVDYIPDQLLRPYVSGRTLHVGAVMLAYTVGPLLFGWYGIFLAPFILVVVFEFARIVFPWLVSAEGAEIGEIGDATPGAASPEMVAEAEHSGSADAPPDSETAADSAIDEALSGDDAEGSGAEATPSEADAESTSELDERRSTGSSREGDPTHD